MSINWTDVFAWMKGNQIILGLLASAIVITMPEMLPHWREFPQWMWSWFRDAMKTFMNFRHSGAPITDTEHAQHQTIIQQKRELLQPKPKLPELPTGPQQLNG